MNSLLSYLPFQIHFLIFKSRQFSFEVTTKALPVCDSAPLALHLQNKNKNSRPKSKLQKWVLHNRFPVLPFMSIRLYFIRFLGSLGILGFSLFALSISMEGQEVQVGQAEIEKNDYSVWAVPPEDVRARLKTLMGGLRSEFGGPDFEPHVTVVGAISLTAGEARDKFRSACEGLKAYTAIVEKVATGTFFYQCVFLLLHPSAEVVETSAHCIGHFGYKNSTPYMPHLSLLYGDLLDEEKKKAQEKANSLDESISSLSFQITKLALYKTDTQDKTLKSWEMVEECILHTI